MDAKILKLLKKIFLFSVFCFLLCYPILVFIWGQSISNFDSGHLRSRLIEIESVKDVDILIVGSSRSYRHYDPRIFEKEGFEVFVLGSSAQSLIQSEFLLKKYIAQLNPQLIVLDVYPNMFTKDGVESTLDIISNSNKNLELGTLELVLKHKNIKVLNTMLYHYFSEFVQNSTSEDGKEHDEGDIYIKGGYVEKENRFSEIEKFPARNIRLNETQVESFHNIVDLVKNSGAELFLVQSPMYKAEFESYRNLDKIDSLLNMNNLQLYVSNEEIDLNDSLHFYDSSHLNNYGVKIYNEFFIQVILEREEWDDINNSNFPEKLRND